MYSHSPLNPHVLPIVQITWAERPNDALRIWGPVEVQWTTRCHSFCSFTGMSKVYALCPLCEPSPIHGCMYMYIYFVCTHICIIIHTFRFWYCTNKWYILVFYKQSLGISSLLITWDSNRFTSFKIPGPATFLCRWWHICWHRHLLCTMGSWELNLQGFQFKMSLQTQPLSNV